MKYIFDFKFYILGDGKVFFDEVGLFRFLLLVFVCWNGIVMGVIDLVWCYVIIKEYVDIGMCIVDYLMI